MNEPITLSDEQREEITLIYEQCLEAVQSLKPTDVEGLHKLQEDKNNRVRGILTQDQYRAFEAATVTAYRPGESSTGK
ncbi:hypothetical protein [Marinoscillum furvescens]|uniref:Uncharacterized protein n=1 Tax=Marinoscillum furvescens DSM 4134 TaxID=1122208 RepID=A0A3D9KY11_MARFU|nr:hypothetical protein [Marinoscillum furvescens]RED92202.1 hypothetical protein C7460_13214 [Marinoscillum furvescens DSM 4134]